MNRKQRRALRHSGAKAAPGSHNAAHDDTFAKLFNAAAAAHQAGALIEAERGYRHILSLVPAQAETQSRLGAVLMAQGKISEAIGWLEGALALKPDLFEAYGNLAQAYVAAALPEQAVEAAARALEIRPTPQGKALFVRAFRHARITTDKNSRLGKMAARALLEGWAPPRDLTEPCIGLIKLDSAVKECMARCAAAWPACLPASKLFGAMGVATLADNALLCALLACDPISDIDLERFLTNVRSVMLDAALDTDQAGKTQIDDRELGFYCAVARQCFINEYVYALPAAEADRVTALQTALSDKIEAGTTVPPLWPVALGAYRPLHAVPNIAALDTRPWPASVKSLLAAQVDEPAEEHRIAASIPVLTSLAGEVSRAVRRQYEENPYPRWVKMGSGTVAGAPAPKESHDVLIAGCGTGLSTIEIAQAMPGARILAVDLSIASLSYGKRVADRLGLGGIEFAQADIMEMGAIGRNFDFIDASGVLHHLADPWAGFKILLKLLRPGGTMQVSLYSDLARRNIVAARALIAARGYQPTPHDIRRCREDIARSDDPILKSLTKSQDFFTTSECRDLLFHVQEHRVALPEIKSFLTANDLIFAGFLVDAATLQRFAARFPGHGAQNDLDRWHAFESETPNTFAAMYQFQVRKPRAPG